MSYKEGKKYASINDFSWESNRSKALACKTFLVPKMEAEKLSLLKKFSCYYDFTINPGNSAKGLVHVSSAVHDMRRSKKTYKVEVFTTKRPITGMGGHCSCLRPQQRRIPCAHLLFFAQKNNFSLDWLFRVEHTSKYWRWQYEEMGDNWKVPELADLQSSGIIAAPVVGAPLRGRPKKGKRLKSILERVK